jgi:hypothetical protein
MTHYRCTYVGCDSRMFTEGRIYQHIEAGEHQPTVRDDLGHLRVIGHDLSFIVRNDYPRGGIYRALFEPAE